MLILFNNCILYLFQFKYTDTQRTKESARHFTIGLFGEEASDSVWFPKPPPQDPILRVVIYMLYIIHYM